MLSTNNPSISAKYKFYRNKITHLIESLKQNYYRSKFENCRNDVKTPGKLKLFLQKQKKAKYVQKPTILILLIKTIVKK